MSSWTRKQIRPGTTEGKMYYTLHIAKMPVSNDFLAKFIYFTSGSSTFGRCIELGALSMWRPPKTASKSAWQRPDWRELTLTVNSDRPKSIADSLSRIFLMFCLACAFDFNATPSSICDLFWARQNVFMNKAELTPRSSKLWSKNSQIQTIFLMKWVCMYFYLIFWNWMTRIMLKIKSCLCPNKCNLPPVEESLRAFFRCLPERTLRPVSVNKV